MGSFELELVATLTTEKSLATKHDASAANATSTKTNCPAAIGRAVAMSAARFVAAPASGSTRLRERERERDDEREVAELGNHGLPPFCPAKAPLSIGCPALLQRLGGLGRHVVLVVLGEHLARAEDAVGAELALRDHALALLEEVGKDAGEDHGNRLRGVGHAEAHGERVLVARHAARLDQPADAERAVLRRLVGGHLRWA